MTKKKEKAEEEAWETGDIVKAVYEISGVYHDNGVIFRAANTLFGQWSKPKERRTYSPAQARTIIEKISARKTPRKGVAQRITDTDPQNMPQEKAFELSAKALAGYDERCAAWHERIQELLDAGKIEEADEEEVRLMEYQEAFEKRIKL
jgi:hypothetical protein